MGADADLVLWDGVRLVPSLVVAGGRIVFRDGVFLTPPKVAVAAIASSSSPAAAALLNAAPNSPYTFAVVRLREKVGLWKNQKSEKTESGNPLQCISLQYYVGILYILIMCV